METSPAADQDAQSVEDALRAELHDGDRIIAGSPSALRHLLIHHDEMLFNAQIVATIRGVMGDLARQMLRALAENGGIQDVDGFVSERSAPLLRDLLANARMLTHIHSLAVEMRLIGQLQRDGGIDPAFPPLVRDLADSPAADQAALGMAVGGAQVRFVQRMQRMEHPLRELPGELFQNILALLRLHGAEGGPDIRECEGRLRAAYDEGGANRLALMDRLARAAAPEGGSIPRIEQAGLSIFISALALASRQDRELAMLSLGERQVTRAALSLRAAGLDEKALRAQLLLLHPRGTMPDGLARLGPDRAARLLAMPGSRAAD